MISWLTWFSMGIVFLFTIWIIQHYASKSTSIFVYIFVFLGYFLAFVLVVLLPYDIYLSIEDNLPNIKDLRFVLSIIWRVIYWTVFVLCWVILPIIQEYEMAGDFIWSSRLKSALFRHLRGFLITGVIGIACLGYLFYKGKLTIINTPVFLVVLSNCWGLLLIIVLLGYGIIEIPRQFWKAGNNSTRLCDLYIKTSFMSEDMVETKFALDEIVKLVNAASFLLPKNSELQENMNFILSLVPIEMIEHQRAMQTQLSKDAANQLGKITLERLVSLHKDLKDTLSEYQRSKYRWDSLIEKAIDLEDIITASDSPFKRIVYSFKESKSGCLARLREINEWYWLTRIKPCLFRTLGLLFIIMSILVILGEATLFLEFPIGVFPLMFRESYGDYGTQFLCMIPLSYIILCTFFGIFNLKLSGWYGLYPNNHTDPSNLVWSAFFMARLSAPLCYNFFLFIKVKNTVYSEEMEIIDLVPVVGGSFATFFPLLLVIFALLNIFHAYGRFMSAIGMTKLSFSDKYTSDKIGDGKLIVQRARTEREKKLAAYDRRGTIEMGKTGNQDVRSEFQFKRSII
ncbi:hypothetical protein SteCoe_29108 [Stentor coeruleus]|uniref:LMBR1-like conserved region-containing protein n=1 Tax=Stentor coeruleus TaxID=5963 RepID=A0A1R2B6R4_9CILI|nr:hypothetical protein SteCoe_29108 [Stentor coeruleus]